MIAMAAFTGNALFFAAGCGVVVELTEFVVELTEFVALAGLKGNFFVVYSTNDSICSSVNGPWSLRLENAGINEPGLPMPLAMIIFHKARDNG